MSLLRTRRSIYMNTCRHSLFVSLSCPHSFSLFSHTHNSKSDPNYHSCVSALFVFFVHLSLSSLDLFAAKKYGGGRKTRMHARHAFPFLSLSVGYYLVNHGFTLSANLTSSLLLLHFSNLIRYSNGQAHGPTPRCCCGGGGGVVLLVLPAMQRKRPARNTSYRQSLAPR